MTCNVIRFPDGAAIVCGRQPRAPKCWVEHCTKKTVRWCDYAIAEGKTCSRGICIDHATAVDAEHDLCPEHAKKGDRRG